MGDDPGAGIYYALCRWLNAIYQAQGTPAFASPAKVATSFDYFIEVIEDDTVIRKTFEELAQWVVENSVDLSNLEQLMFMLRQEGRALGTPKAR
jgi:hypothetical protein